MFWDVSGLCIFHYFMLHHIVFVSSGFAREKCNMRWGFTLNLIPLLDRGSFWDFVVLIFNITLLKANAIWPIKPYLTDPSPIFLLHFAQQKTTPGIKSSSNSGLGCRGHLGRRLPLTQERHGLRRCASDPGPVGTCHITTAHCLGRSFTGREKQ